MPKLVDLADERRKRGGAYRIPCRKCGKPVHEHATRCTHCGIWFDGEAFEFAKRIGLRGRAWKGTKVAFYGLLVLVVLLFVALVFGT